MNLYDVLLDFQVANNPGAVWSYGYTKAGGAGYSFLPFDRPASGSQPSWTMAGYNHSGTPAVWRNLGSSAAFGVGPGQLSIHPGPQPNGDYAIVRFTAPRTGTYRLAGQFYAGDTGNMNARVVKNSDFDHPLQIFATATDNSVINIGQLALNAGNTIDFVVGNNGNFSAGNTPLAVNFVEGAQSTALILSGGGSRGDFEVGAIRYLYEKGIRPNILCGTSVGAINAAKLAEGEVVGGDTQGSVGLQKIWASLQTNDDMYIEEPWLTDPNMDRRLADLLRGKATDFPINAPRESFAWGDFSKLAYFVDGLSFMLSDGVSILNSLQVFLDKARGLYNLGPISKRLQSDFSPALLQSWAAQGGKLRLAMVSLDSGKLRYVTETGAMIERDGTPVSDTASVAPACAGVAAELETLLAEITSIRQEVRDLQLELRTAQTGQKASLVAQIGAARALAATKLALSASKRAALDQCAKLNPSGLTLADIRPGVVASASIPGVFLPIKLGSEYYIDGGIREVAPIQAAVDLGADLIYVVQASSRVLPTFVTPAKAGALSIVARALEDLTIDEIAQNDRYIVSKGSQAPRMVIIEPIVDFHPITVIDPGLIKIASDYGYMRAADSVDNIASNTRRFQISTEIAALRVDIWRLENLVAGKPDPTNISSGTVQPQPGLQVQVDQKKVALGQKIAERRASGVSGPMPPEIDFWTANPELHPWLAVPNNKATFVKQTVQTKIGPGKTASATVVMRNTGRSTWQASRKYALGSQSPADNLIWGTRRQALTSDISPGAEATFTLLVPAPPAAGATFQWQMVQDGVEWFGEKSTATTVTLDDPAVCIELRRQIADLKDQIQVLTDSLDGNVRHDGPIKRAIATQKASLLKLDKQATANGCPP